MFMFVAERNTADVRGYAIVYDGKVTNLLDNCCDLTKTVIRIIYKLRLYEVEAFEEPFL